MKKDRRRTAAPAYGLKSGFLLRAITRIGELRNAGDEGLGVLT